MSDSGFPTLPPTGGSTQTSRVSGNDGQNARLISAPPDVQASVRSAPSSDIRGDARPDPRPVRVEGEVTRSNENGAVRIRTERGNIDVQLPPETRPEQRPQEGQRVSLDVQPNRGNPERPPEQVVIRTQVQQAQAQAQTPEEQQARANPEQTQTRNTQTPLNIEVRPEGAPARESQRATTIQPPIDSQAARNPAPASFPAAGSLVRLEPVSPQQLSQIISTQSSAAQPETLSALLTPSPRGLSSLSFQTDLIAQRAQNTLQASVNTLITPAGNTVPTAPPVNAAQPSAAQSNVFAGQSFTPPTQDVQIARPPLLASIFASNPPSPPLASSAAIPTTSDNAALIRTFVPTPPIASQTQFFAPQSLPPQTATTATVSSSQPASQPASQPPSSLDVRVTGVAPPLVQINPPSSANAAANTAQTTTASTSTAQTTSAGQSLPALILQNQNAGQITGTVIAQTTSQAPVLTLFFPQGLSSGGATQSFALQFPSEPVALGTQLHVTPQAAAQAASQVGASSTLQTLQSIGVPIGSVLAPQPWQVLQDVQNTLLQAAPAQAQAFSGAAPSPANPVQFGAAALFFIAAIRSGDVSGWLGDKASDALRAAGRGNLITRLAGEGSILNAVSSEPISGEWRATNIPLQWQGEFHKVSLHYKHDEGQGDSDIQGGQKSTRFVFDLSLSAMGSVQVDGLFRPVSESGARLDVILRTEQHFSQSMKMEMRRLYTDAIKPSEIGGELSFQNADEGWVTITAEEDSALGVSA